MESDASWKTLLSEPRKQTLELRCLPSWLRGNRWFAGKARALRGVKILNSVSLDGPDSPARLVFVEATYLDAEPEMYLVPMQISSGAVAHRLLEESPALIIVRLTGDSVLH